MNPLAIRSVTAANNLIHNKHKLKQSQNARLQKLIEAYGWDVALYSQLWLFQPFDFLIDY